MPSTPDSAVVEYGSQAYRIRIGSHISKEAEYGDPCILRIGSRYYIAAVDKLGDEYINLLDLACEEGAPMVIQGFTLSSNTDTFDDNDPGLLF